MSFYQSLKSMKAAVIGTIMPWTGAISEIPKGWIICDGTQVDGSDYPLLVQVIGDTYNTTGQPSELGGSFPAYTGKFYIPNLINGKALMDLEASYFASTAAGGTGKAVDTDPDARNLIEPYIGANRDESVPTVFTDVRTDVEFTLNDRNDYQGVIKGNTIIDGQGERVIFIGGRKLGHTHIQSHPHTGAYETINSNPANKPGLGVIPWDNVELSFKGAVTDIESDGDSDDPQTYDRVDGGWVQTYQGIVLRGSQYGFSYIEGVANSGFGGGSEGRVVAGINTENPPVNIKPISVSASPISALNSFNAGNISNGRMTSEATIDYGASGTDFEIPQNQQNFLSDYDPSVISPAPAYFGTLLSNTGSDWLDDDQNQIFAHTHDPFTVIYDQGSLKPVSRLYPVVNIPGNTDLDNESNKGAFQIDMNTAQPSLTCIYLIRAY